jgi:hypothetical protein
MLYPIEELQTDFFASEDVQRIQCAFIWLQTFRPEEIIPKSSTPSYSELWFMLKYFQQIQILVNSLPSCYDHMVNEHAMRYNDAVSLEFEKGSMTFLDLRFFDFSVLISAVSGCAARQ